MKKFVLITVVFMAMFMALAQSVYAQVQALNMLSYYPSPSGIYATLRLFPLDSAPACSTPAVDTGKIYYDEGDDELKVCTDDGSGVVLWKTIASGDDSYWDRNAGSLYQNDLKDFIGIGEPLPTFMLTLKHDAAGIGGGIISKGSITDFGTGPVLSNPSGGTKFIWYPRKAAFRAGHTTANQWDNNNIGDYSAAAGYDNIASGEDATAFSGQNNQVAAENSFIGGGLNNSIPASSTGENTILGGEGNTASGNQSTVLGGKENLASALRSGVGCGQTNTASADYAFVGGGLNNMASAQYATVGAGQNNTASGEYATICGGNGNSASQDYSSISGGLTNTSNGQYATIGGGKGNTASVIGTTISGGESNSASGQYATISAGGWNMASGDYSWPGGKFMQLDSAAGAADHTFVWGYANAAPAIPIAVKDAFLIFPYTPTAKVGIGTDNPTATLDVRGPAIFSGLLACSGGESNVKADPAIGLILKEVSSKRYKENIKELQVDTGKVLQLRPVRFEWKENGRSDIGLIAEEVQEIIPELVIYNAEGTPQSVKYDRISLYLLQAAKEGLAQSQALKEQVDALTRP